MDKNIQGIFFSKENISTLNKKLLEELRLQNANVDIKKDILHNLVENMTSVWNSIDKTKINNSNFNNIFSQFNSFSYQNCLKKLKLKYNSNFTGIPANKPVSQPAYPPSQPTYPPSQPTPPTQPKPTQPYPSTIQQPSDLNQFYGHLTPGLPDAYQDPNLDPASMKFRRDFDINKDKKVMIPERSKTMIGGNEHYIRQSEETRRMAGNFQQGVDEMFRPIIDNPPDEPDFNSYQYQRGGDVKKQMDDIRFQRDNEAYIPRKPQQNEVPDFLRPKATSIRTHDEYQRDRDTKQPDSRDSKQPDSRDQRQPTKKSLKSGGDNSNEFLSGLHGDNDDLMSLDNFDKPIIDDNIEEDSAPFADRLNRLKADRDSVSIPKQNVDFKSENFEDTYDDVEPTSIRDLKKKKTVQNDDRQRRLEPNDDRQSEYERQRRQMDERNGRQSDNTEDEREYYERRREVQDNERRREEYERRRSEQDTERRREEPDRRRDTNIDVRELYNNYIKIKKAYESINEENLKLKIELETKPIQKVKKMSSDERKEYIGIFNDLKKINEQLVDELKNLKTNKISLETDNKTLENEINTLKEKLSPEFLDLDKIKKEIQNEFVELTKHKQDTENKIKELDLIKTENNDKIKELETKKNELENKEQELQKVINEYNNLPQIKLYQMEICNENNSSYYTYNFDQLNNISSIKLLGYSIPSNLFNIEEDKNNTFEFQINEEPNEIKLETGKYNIDELLKALNKNNYGFIFTLDQVTQKVVVANNVPFKIISSPLSIIVLGFCDNNYNDNIEYKATKMYDLRNDNKVLLYLNNIDNQTPFAILIPNSTSPALIKFEEPISLDKLDILFKDSKGRLHNFYNLEHTISLQIEVKN